MVTTEERMRILQMLQDGKITPDAAAQLLDAINAGDAPIPEPPAPQVPAYPSSPELLAEEGLGKAHWLHVRVTDTDTGKPRVNVRLPIGLISLGVKLGTRFAPEIEGMDIQALLQAAQTSGPGPMVDVYDDDDGEHVEVYLE